MIQKKTLRIILLCVIASLVGVGGYFVLFKKQTVFTDRPQSEQVPPSLDETQSERINVASEEPFIVANWQTYRNENYGIVFKYPDNLKVSENFSGVFEFPIGFISKNQQSENTGGINPRISISFTCLVPENVPKESWENNFQKPMVFNDPLEELAAKFLKTYEIGERKLFVFTQGCYECYDSFNEETQTYIPDPNTEYDGFSAYSCKAGINKNGNPAVGCITTTTGREKTGSLELQKLQKFFLDDFIPTLEFYEGLINVRDCDGLGESVG